LHLISRKNGGDVVVVNAEPSVAALVLAGGLSSRMGTDKALIPVGGTPLLQRVVTVAQQCCDEVWVMTPWGDRYHAILPEGVRILEEARPEQTRPPGPLVALQKGLRNIEADWILLLACDLPNLDGAILQDGRSQLNDLPASIQAMIPKTDRWEPLCGFYRRSCEVFLDSFIAKGGRSFQNWLNQQEVQPFMVSASMLLNCNTPEDLQTSQYPFQ
jgi:molybdopterin-guanine dinucleotide biosynthesis protein A